jgi:hypothetical protein
MFPLNVWMAGGGTQFNMNLNEVISNSCCQLAGKPLGNKTPVCRNDPRKHAAILKRFFSHGHEQRGGSKRERAADSSCVDCMAFP